MEDIPDFKSIKSLDRGVKWKIVFGNKIKSKREKIGNQWEFEHPEFQIAVHTIEPEINIVKLITNKEIDEHQGFFEKCAKDYRNLATELINRFAKKHNLDIDSDYPMNNLNPSEQFGYKQVGKMDNWRYAFHGFHCAFTNLKSGQHIEVPLMCGLEFGELDPYFFSGFIKSTEEYRPRPIEIYDDYSEGKRILDRMVELGKFEEIQSNWPNRKGIVVTDRDKVKVEIYNPEIELERDSLHRTKYRNNRESDFKTNINKNKLWSKLKNLWS
ncbi:DUF6896 domain-containing protein [Aquimarina rhabdastrellae]